MGGGNGGLDDEMLLTEADERVEEVKVELEDDGVVKTLEDWLGGGSGGGTTIGGEGGRGPVVVVEGVGRVVL